MCLPMIHVMFVRKVELVAVSSACCGYRMLEMMVEEMEMWLREIRDIHTCQNLGVNVE